MPISKTEKLERRLLTKEEVRLFAERLKQMMGTPLMEMSHRHGVSIEDHFRFHSLAVRLRDTRIERGLSLKATSSALRTAQYRLAAIESNQVGRIDAQLLVRYVDHLGMKNWFGRWKTCNPSLARRIRVTGAGNVTTAPRATRRKRRAPEAER